MKTCTRLTRLRCDHTLSKLGTRVEDGLKARDTKALGWIRVTVIFLKPTKGLKLRKFIIIIGRGSEELTHCQHVTCLAREL